MAASYSLTGRGLTPTSGGTDPLVVTVTGGNSTQLNLAVVACEVVASGASGSYSYQWTLTDPSNTDRTALLDDDTIDSPTFTPDATPGGGQWVARCAVTSGSQTVTVSKIVTVGQSVSSGPNWIRVFNYVSNGSDAASPSGGTLAFGGKTWTVVNADAASGPKVDGGDLSITPAPGIQITGSSIANVAALRISLNALTGLSTVGARRLMFLAELEDYTPTASDEGFIFGLEVAGAGFGAGATARAVGAGQGVTGGTIRGSRVIGQSSATLRSTYSTATSTPCRSFAAIFCQSGLMAYSSSTVGALDTASEVITATPRNSGGSEAAVDFASYNQVFIAAQKPTTGANGAEFRLKEFRVFVC